MIHRIVFWICNFLIGEKIYSCPRCKGKGRVTEYHNDIVGFSGSMRWKEEAFCKKCDGTGEVDWVQKVTGKR